METKSQESLVFRKPLDGALFCLEKGFKIFPCIPDGKTPAVSGWQEWAETATQDKIEKYAKANPTSNWGISCGPSGLTVVDVDMKKGRDGLSSLKNLILAHDKLPKTLQVKTPSGGYHFFFKGLTKSSVAFLTGLDTRSQGGYVVAPGSRLQDQTYEITALSDIAEIPSWLSSVILEAKAQTKVLTDTQDIPEGQRNEFLASLAGSMRARGMSYEAILAALEVMNETKVHPALPQQEVEQIARSISRYQPDQAIAASDFLKPVHLKAQEASSIQPGKLKPREWVMKDRYIKGFVSVLISPGGVGKSTLALLDGASVALSKPLSGFEVTSPGAVWIYNLEDPMEELERRIVALSFQHQVPTSTMSGLFYSSGTEEPFIVAKQDQSGVIINQKALDEAVSFIQEKKIQLFIVDPFVRTHELNENDNMQMDKVVWAFQRIATRANCAVGLIHHTSKAGASADPGEMHSGRGASSLIYAARIAHTLNFMTKEEAGKFGIAQDKKRWYMRLDNAKANLQPPAESAIWYERRSVVLPTGDNVGTVEHISGFKEVVKDFVDKIKASETTVLGNMLDELFRAGDVMTMNDMIEKLMDLPGFQKTFKEYRMVRSFKNRVSILFGDSRVLKFHEKVFTMTVDHITTSKGIRAVVVVKCSQDLSAKAVDPGKNLASLLE